MLASSMLARTPSVRVSLDPSAGQESLRGKTLRVQFLGNTGGWKGNYCVLVGETGRGSQVWGGTEGVHD